MPAEEALWSLSTPFLHNTPRARGGARGKGVHDAVNARLSRVSHPHRRSLSASLSTKAAHHPTPRRRHGHGQGSHHQQIRRLRAQGDGKRGAVRHRQGGGRAGGRQSTHTTHSYLFATVLSWSTRYTRGGGRLFITPTQSLLYLLYTPLYSPVSNAPLITTNVWTGP